MFVRIPFETNKSSKKSSNKFVGNKAKKKKTFDAKIVPMGHKTTQNENLNHVQIDDGNGMQKGSDKV